MISKKYYSLAVNNNEADIYIFGDIVEPTVQELFGMPADVSGFSLVQEIKSLEVNVINVHINSYGGHVSEGFAIYNELRNHKARIRTICEGFGCSAASVVFMAGDERIMKELSALFIHEVQCGAYGNADDMRKAADDNEKLTKISMQAYLPHIKISEEKLTEMMKVETWLTPQEALDMGFATSIIAELASNKAVASAKKQLMTLILQRQKQDPAPVAPDPVEPEPAPVELEPVELEPVEPDPEPAPQENKVLKMLAAFSR